MNDVGESCLFIFFIILDTCKSCILTKALFTAIVFNSFTVDKFCRISSSCLCIFGCLVMTKR